MKTVFPFFICALSVLSCANATNPNDQKKLELNTMTNQEEKSQLPADSIELATFGAGCFWCVEAIYQNVKGVVQVQSGYSGGSIKNPSYKELLPPGIRL